MMEHTRQQTQRNTRIPPRRHEHVTTSMSFRCTVGMFTSAAVCAATCAAAFSLHQPGSASRGVDLMGSLLRPPSIFSVSHQRTLRLLATNNNEAQADDDEWKALVAAFQMYKAAYGDLKVPSRFIVPSLPPWPGTCVCVFVRSTCRSWHSHACSDTVTN